MLVVARRERSKMEERMKEGEGGRREKRKTRKEREDSKSEKKREDHRQYGKWDENDTLFISITCISI